MPNDNIGAIKEQSGAWTEHRIRGILRGLWAERSSYYAAYLDG